MIMIIIIINIIIIIIIIITTYLPYGTTALKNFDRPLMRVSLSNLICLYLFSTRGRVIGDMSIASWANYIGTKVLLGGD